MNLKRALMRFLADETAVTSIEYALVGALIAAVCVVTLVALGGNLKGLFTIVCNKVTEAVTGAPACQPDQG